MTSGALFLREIELTFLQPVPDSLLINGAGRFICSMAVPARPVECEDISEEEMPGLLGANLLIPTRLRVVNVGYVKNFVSLYF